MSTTYYFGKSSGSSSIKINAESIDEAKVEFAFSIDDISRCSNLSNPYGREHSPEEPYGYKDGKILPDAIVPFYGRVDIHILKDGLEKVGEITSSEIALILATPQQKLLVRMTEAHQESESKEIAPSKGMLMLQSQARSLQLNFRNQKRGLLALQSQAALKRYSNEREFDRLQSEQRILGEKINIMSVYAGMGKDVVKIRSGKASDRKVIDIFQSFRFMREDIELLSDFEDFDYTSLDSFDSFISEHYKDLLPSELCIQAFRISKFPILYKRESVFGETLQGDKANNKIFILVRNGENVYRFFNTYKLGNGLFSSTNDLETITKKLGKFDDNVRAEIDGEPTKHWVIEGETGNRTAYTREIHREYIPSESAWYPDLDTDLLDKMFESCREAFQVEVDRRKTYIAKYGLEKELDPFSWRWGKPYADLKYHFFAPYHQAFERMYTKHAYETNNYRLKAAVSKICYTTYRCWGSNGQDEYVSVDLAKSMRKEGYGVLRYETYRDSGSEREGKVQRFDPDTGAALYASVGRCDDAYMYDGFFGAAKQLFEDERQKLLDKRHLENFHATAILQNIIDNKKLFPDFEGIDFIVGEGMEHINRVEDGGLLLEATADDSLDPGKVLDAILSRASQAVELGMEVNVLRTYEVVCDYRTGREKDVLRNDKAYGEEVYRPLVCKVVGKSRVGVTVEGDFDVYTRYNYRKSIYAGDAKTVKKVIHHKENRFGADDILVPPTLLDDEITSIRAVMKQRTFRETHYLTYGVFFKTLLKLHKKQIEKLANAGGADESLID